MARRWKLGAAAMAAGTALLVAGCTDPPTDSSEIVTFTDGHGRVCTGSVVVDREQSEGTDYEITGLDCEYPPEGRSPGPDSYRPLPQRESD
ncbi:hypothetical protein OG946_29755 [Streptomyces sp. NBC_01808]|uniref:hypothetical protein n=1 Tax=unclassified Streptomyces TaxID=2593676 RepID=UPI001F0BDC3B|nr:MULTISPECIES: hypothetical protein [unclassified Streptomyces]WSA41197.1 hypothetical protein OG946_29755 [Streptomyces sp. NBC_01808]